MSHVFEWGCQTVDMRMRKKATAVLIFCSGTLLGLLIGVVLVLVPAYRYWKSWDNQAPDEWRRQFAVSALPKPTAEQRDISPDERAVRGLRQTMIDGWNNGDAEAFASVFAADADLIAFDGTHIQGRDAIVAMHEPLFRTYLKGTRLVGEVVDVFLVEPGKLALMHTRTGTIMSGKNDIAAERDSIQTFGAAHQDGEWRFVAFHNNRIRPMGRNAGGTMIWLLSDWLWTHVGS